MMDNKVSYLISKKLSGEISDAESRDLNDYLSSNATLYQVLTQLEAIWQQQDPDQQIQNASIEKLIRKISAIDETFIPENAELPSPPLLQTKAPFWKNKYFRLAAAAMVITLAGIWFISKTNTNEEPAINVQPTDSSANEVVTGPGKSTRIVLHDGTTVWLNANSSLTYKNDFNGRTREVNLQGEAFFDVISNQRKPFIIHTSKIKVKVTGTTFNVRSYEDETKAETSLISGKVEVSLIENPDKIFYLKPSEKLVLTEMAEKGQKIYNTTVLPSNNRKLKLIPEITSIFYDPIDSIPVETAWLNNQLAFYNEPFRDVADKMENWYGKTIVFASPALEKIRFTGKFQEETLEEALQAMQIIVRFQFDIKNKTIVITAKN